MAPLYGTAKRASCCSFFTLNYSYYNYRRDEAPQPAPLPPPPPLYTYIYSDLLLVTMYYTGVRREVVSAVSYSPYYVMPFTVNSLAKSSTYKLTGSPQQCSACTLHSYPRGYSNRNVKNSSTPTVSLSTQAPSGEGVLLPSSNSECLLYISFYVPIYTTTFLQLMTISLI